MYVTPVPPEPIALRFDSQVFDDGDFRRVFEIPTAWALWLMIKPGHLATPSFHSWCLMMAGKIERVKKPISVEDLHGIIRGPQTVAGGRPYLSDDIEESRAFLERLALAVNGIEPIRYQVVSRS
jgi:hypothetical protein